MTSVIGSRKLLAFLFTMACLTALRGYGQLGDEAFMVVASAALGGFFTANVMSKRAMPEAKV